MFTNFAPRPDMRANELSHTQTLPLPLHIASLMIAELGAPSFRSRPVTAWYADAHIDLPGRAAELSCPFALRIDSNGNATLTVRWSERELMDRAICSLVPNIYIEPAIRGARRA